MCRIFQIQFQLFLLQRGQLERMQHGSERFSSLSKNSSSFHVSLVRLPLLFFLSLHNIYSISFSVVIPARR